MIVRAPRADLDRLGARVHPHLVAAGAAQQAIHRHLIELAGNVPQRHVNGRNHVQHQPAAAQVAMGAEQPLPVMLDPRRVFADDQRSQRLGQGTGDLGLHIVDLAPADHPHIRLHLHVPLGPHRNGRQALDPNGRAAIFHCHELPPILRFASNAIALRLRPA